MEFLMAKFAWLQANWDQMAEIIVALGVAAEGVVRLTPTKTDDGAMTRIGKIVDQLLTWFPNLKKK